MISGTFDEDLCPLQSRWIRTVTTTATRSGGRSCWKKINMGGKEALDREELRGLGTTVLIVLDIFWEGNVN